MPLLQIRGLTLEFASGSSRVRVVDDVSLEIGAGETLALVGESGCGKSVTALSIAKLVPSPPAVYKGEVLLEGRDVMKMTAKELGAIRGEKVAYVFQEPSACLNPVMRVGHQIMEALKLHRPGKAKAVEVERLLGMVGIPDPAVRARAYPFQLSGGMQQRVMIAMALASEPPLLVADEPTTALDVTIQAQIMELLENLRQRLGMAMLLITHNLAVVGQAADRVAVMYAGQIVEEGAVRELIRSPRHPYTAALLRSVPRLRRHPAEVRERLETIPGSVPAPGQYPPGCRFYPRCPSRQASCADTPPALEDAGAGRRVRCPYWRELAGAGSPEREAVG